MSIVEIPLTLHADRRLREIAADVLPAGMRATWREGAGVLELPAPLAARLAEVCDIEDADSVETWILRMADEFTGRRPS